MSVSGVEAPRSSNVEEFEDMVRKDLVGVSPTYILPLMKKSLPPPSAIPFLSTCGASPSLLNKWCYTSRPTVPYLLSPPPFMFVAPETPSPFYSPSSLASHPLYMLASSLSIKIVLMSSSLGYRASRSLITLILVCLLIFLILSAR